MQYSITVNDRAHVVEAKPDLPLVWVIKDVAGRHTVSIGCGRGTGCGGCVVRLNGEQVNSCSITIEQAQGGVVLTPGYKPPEA